MNGNWIVGALSVVCLALVAMVSPANAGCHGQVQEVRRVVNREVVGYRYVEPVEREIRLVERVVVDDYDYDYGYGDQEVLEVRRQVNRDQVRRAKSVDRERFAKSRSRASTKTVRSSSRQVVRSSQSY